MFMEGAQVNYEAIHLPDEDNPYVLQYLLKNKENKIMVDKSYILMDENGNIQKGKTDKNGLMRIKTTPSSQNITTRVIMNEIEQAEEEDSGDQT